MIEDQVKGEREEAGDEQKLVELGIFYEVQYAIAQLRGSFQPYILWGTVCNYLQS